jgi:crossover junction endodeoxyribonuclease RusA
MKSYTFFIPGKPIAKGSTHTMRHKYAKDPQGRAKLITRQTNADNQALWNAKIAFEVRKKIKRLTTGPVKLSMKYIFSRPKLHLNSKDEIKEKFKNIDYLKKPDIDKLNRCVLDALTGIVYRDDSQVNEISGSKHFQETIFNNEGLFLIVSYYEKEIENVNQGNHRKRPKS